MKRLSLAVSLVVAAVFSSCGAVGRCTADSQCPVGASCDASLGVCVSGSGPTGGGSSTSMISADYGKSCTSDASCASISGTSCTPNANQCLATCGSGQACPVGAECVGQGLNRCLRTCASNADCSSEQYCTQSSYIASKVCMTRVENWSLGRECSSDGDCERSALCVTKTGQSTGVCTKVCASASACAAGQLCVGAQGSMSFCFDSCFEVGQQSTCRSGMTCRALSGVTYGWCG